MANTVSNSRRLMFYEDWTLMGLAAGAFCGPFIPRATIISAALTGSFIGFYISYTTRQLRDNNNLPESIYQAMNFTTKNLTTDA